jgi:hypothetical protein
MLRFSLHEGPYSAGGACAWIPLWRHALEMTAIIHCRISQLQCQYAQHGRGRWVVHLAKVKRSQYSSISISMVGGLFKLGSMARDHWVQQARSTTSNCYRESASLTRFLWAAGWFSSISSCWPRAWGQQESGSQCSAICRPMGGWLKTSV